MNNFTQSILKTDRRTDGQKAKLIGFFYQTNSLKVQERPQVDYEVSFNV